MRICHLILLLLLGLISLSASAAMYKYTDEKGRVVYSQSPPPTGDAELIKPPPPPATPVESEPETQQEPLQTTDSADDPAEAARRKDESDRIKAENCDRARKQLQLYQNPQNRLLKRPDGTYQRVTDELRQQGVESARKSIQEFCN